ncbi:resolvase [Photobacterium frigidiphilum]|jgi:DNA invertase Pin-like site-specific DNA recombinase|uniref:Resolvase n=1 Tax=Photobacterium frigidiphilum TaxID=264736 RepID=A0A2T3J5Y4_9GAMM|nr:recombinase family protein [Photobacterium frigidiphilum]PSU42008.1 resolvase [Photobacterium frigidiphilum]
MRVARIYIRVSTREQDLQRQESIRSEAIAAGYYIAGIYREKASGARADRPELLRMISDLQPDETVIAENIDRISRLPLPEAEKLINSIKAKGALLSIPGLVDLSDLVADSEGIARIVIESVQQLLLKLALQMAREDYETHRERQLQGIQLAKAQGKYKGRKANQDIHHQIIALRKSGTTIQKTADITGCSISQVKRVWALFNQGNY